MLTAIVLFLALIAVLVAWGTWTFLKWLFRSPRRGVGRTDRGGWFDGFDSDGGGGDSSGGGD